LWSLDASRDAGSALTVGLSLLSHTTQGPTEEYRSHQLIDRHDGQDKRANLVPHVGKLLGDQLRETQADSRLSDEGRPGKLSRVPVLASQTGTDVGAGTEQKGAPENKADSDGPKSSQRIQVEADTRESEKDDVDRQGGALETLDHDLTPGRGVLDDKAGSDKDQEEVEMKMKPGFNKADDLDAKNHRRQQQFTG